MRAQLASDSGAWQALAAAWGARLEAGADACATLPAEGLRCYRHRHASLNLLRQLDRPVLLTLYPQGDDAAPVTVLLRGLDGTRATLAGGGDTVQVPVAALAQWWRGEIATLWRAPAAMPERGNIADAPPGAAWLDQQLARAVAGAAGPAPAQRQARIHRFQLAQGLVPDGRAGPLTLMLLNRMAGVAEPRLQAGS